jgi:hypothetical protein
MDAYESKIAADVVPLKSLKPMATPLMHRWRAADARGLMM